MTRNTVAEPTTTKSLVPDAVDRARNVSQFLDRVAGAVVEAQADGGRSLSDRARQGRTLVGTVLRRRRLSPLAWSALLAIALPTLDGALTHYSLTGPKDWQVDPRPASSRTAFAAANILTARTGWSCAAEIPPIPSKHQAIHHLSSKSTKIVRASSYRA